MSEESNLLNKNAQSYGANEDKGEEVPHQHNPEDELFGLTEHSDFKTRLFVLLQQASPIVISYVLGFGGNFINMVFAGRYGFEGGDQSTIFAGITLANTFANVSCLSIIIGMGGAIETLCSQHNGAGNYRQVGIVLQRSWLILLGMMIPLVTMWIWAYNVFSFLGIDPNVCRVIENYLRIRAICLPLDVIMSCYEQYLMSIGVVKPSMYAHIAQNLTILCLDYWFVVVLELPYQYLGWAWVISTVVTNIIQVAMSLPYKEVQRTLQAPDWEAWTEWSEFLQLGWPGAVMDCSEWWAFEIITVLASTISTKDAAVQSILFQTVTIAFMIPLGIGVAAASLVGNSIGAKFNKLARRIGAMAIGVVLCVQGCLAVTLAFSGRYFIEIFTQDEIVRERAAEAMIYVSVFLIFDGIQCVISCIFRGTGKQSFGAMINVTAFYMVGLPLAYLFCFRLGFGLNGLLMGLTAGSLSQCCILVYSIYNFSHFLYTSNIDLSSKNTSSKDNKIPDKASYQALSTTDVEENKK